MKHAGWKAVSAHAENLFAGYGPHGFKVYKETGSQVLFVNQDCDTSTVDSYNQTFQFGFWLYKHEDVIREVPEDRPADDQLKPARPKCLTNGHHTSESLEVVYEDGVENHSSAVVRWCRECGAVVVDVDVDNRTYPGRIKPMQFPRVSK